VVFPSWSAVPPLEFSFCAFVGFLVFVGLAYKRLFSTPIYLCCEPKF
jgi:hypothetical protein